MAVVEEEQGPLGIAQDLVGAGGISGAHLEAYARHGLNVVAVCSRNIARAKAQLVGGIAPVSRANQGEAEKKTIQ